MAKSLYICYFGLLEPLVQAQVIPYLLEIAKDGTEVNLLTFERDFKVKWSQQQIETERARLANVGIGWECMSYHKRFSVLATIYDVLRGAGHIRRRLASENFDILHVRAHIPGPMAILARKFSRSNPKILFDIRGFVPEEYTDAGIWPKDGWLYKLVKLAESWLMKESDGFVVLTEKAREILFPEAENPCEEGSVEKNGRPVEVIPCCVDLKKRFSQNQDEMRKSTRTDLKLDGRLVITHVGALGGLYLTKALADFMATARGQNAGTFALFLTQSDPGLIVPLLEKRGFADADYLVKKVSSVDVPKYLCASDIGMSFVRAGYATQSRSPTKIPEYLACGLPIIANSGVGDVDALVERNGVGVSVDDLSPVGYQKALNDLEALGNISEKCRETAFRGFDLEKVGGKRYRRLYKNLLESR